jgi:hypothetical protein
MKTSLRNFKLQIIACATFFMASQVLAQNKPSIAVLNLDSKGLNLDPAQVGNLARIELAKLDVYQVMDRYDVAYLVDRNQLKTANCYGKLCLLEIGKVLNMDKMFTGSVELYGETILISLNIFDVKSGIIEKTQIKEFLNLPLELSSMLGITLHEMFHLSNNEEMVTKLTKKFNYDNATNNPQTERLALDGPRMGFALFTGSYAKMMHESKANGGLDASPFMFQFGYQFEKQYLNEGNFQALFELIPMVTGVDQGFFFPTLTLMNGFRSNKSGWEFAFGPTIGFNTEAEGYYVNDKWHLKYEYRDTTKGSMPAIVTRSDSRGDLKLTSGFVFACGKTFKSGKLNIPINAYFVPNKEGFRCGISMGFNGKNRRKIQ